MLSSLVINKTMTKEQLNDYSKSELIDLIESYQNHIRNTESNEKAIYNIVQNFSYTYSKVENNESEFTLKKQKNIEISKTEPHIMQKSKHDEPKKIEDIEKNMIRYKHIVNTLLNAATNEQRNDLIIEIQQILDNSRDDIF